MAYDFDKPDGPRAEIVKALRDAGCSVDLLPGGKGRPDLLIGHAGVNWLLEVKALKGKLKAAQVVWHAVWRGQVATVRTVDEALVAVGLLR